MTIAIYSLIFALLMIIITKAPLAYAMNKLEGGYDNRHPREQHALLDGFGKRALATHQNTIEAFPMFAAGLLAALWAEANIEIIEYLCVTFVLARLIYSLCYLFDVHILRSIAWTAGIGSSIALMFLALP